MAKPHEVRISPVSLNEPLGGSLNIGGSGNSGISGRSRSGVSKVRTPRVKAVKPDHAKKAWFATLATAVKGKGILRYVLSQLWFVYKSLWVWGAIDNAVDYFDDEKAIERGRNGQRPILEKASVVMPPGAETYIAQQAISILSNLRESEIPYDIDLTWKQMDIQKGYLSVHPLLWRYQKRDVEFVDRMVSTTMSDDGIAPGETPYLTSLAYMPMLFDCAGWCAYRLNRVVAITGLSRSVAKNKKVGGNPNSRHLTGHGADLVVYDGKGKNDISMLPKLAQAVDEWKRLRAEAIFRTKEHGFAWLRESDHVHTQWGRGEIMVNSNADVSSKKAMRSNSQEDENEADSSDIKSGGRYSAEELFYQ